MSKKAYGNVYEIKLANSKYIYLCWIEECCFGIYDCVLEKPTELNQLLFVGFKAYKECNEKAAKKGIWKLIGHIDIEKENIQLPDLVIFQNWNKEHSIQQSKAMRHGNLLKIPIDEYLSLLKKGYIYGFFDDYRKFEQWLTDYIEDYPENQNIFPLPNS